MLTAVGIDSQIVPAADGYALLVEQPMRERVGIDASLYTGEREQAAGRRRPLETGNGAHALMHDFAALQEVVPEAGGV